MRLAWLVVLVVGCVESAAVPCGDKLCPPGSKCDPSGLCVPAGCGDGTVSGIEECDTEVADLDCTDYGYYAREGLACSSVCTIDETACLGGRCGDHERDVPELCDGIPAVGLSCIDFGFDVGRLACASSCGPGFAECGTIGWSVAQGAATVDLGGVWIGGPTAQFAVGLGGTILRSTGGAWLPMESPTTENLRAVWGVTGQSVYAVGDNGTILHFNGTAWTKQTVSTTQALYAIYGAGPNDIVAVGDGGTIASFDGTSWRVTTQGSQHLRGVWLNLSGSAFAVGANKMLLLRLNGSWQMMTAPGTPANTELRAVHGVNAVNPAERAVYAVGSDLAANARAVVYRFADGQWTDVSPAGSELYGVWTSARDDVYAVGRLGTMLHYDGTSFQAQDISTTRTLQAVSGSGPGYVVAVNRGGEVFELQGFDQGMETLPAVGYVSAVAIAGSNVFAAGGPEGSAALAYRRDKVAGWKTITFPAGAGEIHGVWGTDVGSNAATFFVGVTGIYRWTAADNDVIATRLVAGNFNAVWGSVSPFVVYAVGPNGRIARSLDGVSWTTVHSTPGLNHLDGVWGTPDGATVFAVGSEGTILRGSGTSWAPMNSGTPWLLYDVWGSATDDVYAVGARGTLLHFDGTKWRALHTGTGEVLYAIHGTHAADIFVGGASGFGTHFDGTSWARMTRTEFDRAGIAASAGQVWFAARDTGVMRFTRAATEERCNDRWDNDRDNAVNCADTECANSLECRRGGVCDTSAVVDCNQSFAGSTYTGIARIDDLPCLSVSTPGPEAAFRFVAPASGEVTVTVSGVSSEYVVVVADSIGDTNACDLATCRSAAATGGQSVTFEATADETYHVVVDGPAYQASDFTLAIDCQ